MKRKVPLKRSTKPLTRTARLRSRGKPRRRTNVCREYLDWLKGQPCCITGQATLEWIFLHFGSTQHFVRIAIDPAHVRTKRNNGDLNNAVPLARYLHEELHQHGIKTFQAKYNIDLKALAESYTARFLADHPEAAA